MAESTFSRKNGQVDWDRIGKIKLEKLMKDESKIDEELESLYPMLAIAKVRVDDSRATPEALVKLFKVTQLVMELKNMYLEGAEGQIIKLEDSIRSHEERLNSRGLNTSSELRALREENLELERRNELLARDLQRAEDNLEKEVKYGHEVSSALSEEKARYSALNETIRHLQNEIKDREVQMVSQRHRLLSKNVEEEEYRVQLKEKNSEINKLLNRIETVEGQNSVLTKENETMGQELESLVNELERKERETDSAHELIAKHDESIDELTEERDMLKIKLEELSDSLHSRAEREEIMVRDLREDLKFYRNQAQEAEAKNIAYRNKIDRLTEEMVAIKTELQTFNEDALRKEIQQRDDLIEDLRDKLQESYRDFELLSLDWDRIDTLVEAKSGGELEGLKSQAALANRLKEKMKVLKGQHLTDVERMRTVQNQLEEKERELVELRERMDAYEKGVYGLRESIRETKQLKLERNLRDKEIATLTKRINDFEIQVSDLIEENEELRHRIGIPLSTKIDLSNIQSLKTVELAKAKALNLTLQKEVDALEEERLKMKESLRLQALARGERAVAMGLNVEDLTAVEEYAARLRGGDSGAAQTAQGGLRPQRPVLNNAQLEKLTIELERVHVEAAEARERVEKLEADSRRLMDENRALEAVIKEVSVTLIKTRGVGGGPAAAGDGVAIPRGLSPNPGDTAPDIKFPVIEKFLKVLEKKKHQDLSRDISGNETVEEHIVEVNQTLREELAAMKIRVQELEAERDIAQRLAESSKKESEAMRLRAAKARGRVLELPAELLLGSVHDYSAGFLTQSSLHRTKHFFSITAGKQRHLYRDFQNFKKEAAEAAERAKKELQEAKQERDAAIFKAEEMDKLANKLAGDPDEGSLRKALVDSQRTVTILRVNEAALRRRYLAIADVEAICRKENGKLKMDLLQHDRVARETIGRLRRSKKELSLRCDGLQKSLADSVPICEYNAVRNNLNLFKAKTKLLLEREQEWINNKMQAETDSRDLISARKKIESLEEELAETKEFLKRAEDSIHELSRTKNHEALKERLAEAMHNVAKLEVSNEMLMRRAEITESKCRALEGAEDQLKHRLDGVEKMYMEATEENIQLREIEVELRNMYEGGVTREEFEKSQDKLKKFEETVGFLNSEIDKFKDIADIAANQTSDLLHLHSADEKEKAILRVTIQELQMEDDNKLLIGKLHHHILALQMSEATAMRKLDTLKSKCMRMENSLVKAEKAIDERDLAVFQIRTEGRGSLRLLQQTVAELRTRVAGQVLLEKHERTCDMVRRLERRKREIEKTLKAVENKTRALEGAVAETELKIKQQEELIEALHEPSTASERIVSWQGRMAKLQIEHLHMSREIEHLAKDKITAERNLEDQLERVANLEDDMLALQKETDLKQLDWERRQESLEAMVQHLQEEREEIFKAASVADIKNAMPDRSKPVSHQLEASLRMLVERSRLLTAQEIKITTLEAKISELQKELHEKHERIEEKNLHITQLRTDITQRDLQPGSGLTEHDENARSLVRKREGQAIQSAQDVIRSLQRQLSKKDELVERYRKMVTEIRKEVAYREEQEKTEISSLTEVINTLNDRQVDKLKHVPDAPFQMIATREGDPDPAVVRELEDLVHAKEAELVGVREKLHSLQNSFKAYKETSEEEISTLRKGLTFRDEQIARCEEDFDAMKRELDAYRCDPDNAAANASESIQVRGLKEQISKLKREVDKRETKISKMNDAIAEMKEVMIRTAEEAATAKLRDPDGSANESRDSYLEKKLIQMENKFERLSKSAEKAQKELQTMVSKLKSELTKKEKEFNKIADENANGRRLIDELKTRLKQMTLDRNDLMRQINSGGYPDKSRAASAQKKDESLNLNSGAGTRSRTSSAVPQGAAAMKGTLNAAQAAAEERKYAADVSKDKWEQDKKLQKKFETTTLKLEEKSKDLEDALRRESFLRDTLSRSEQERTRLQRNIQALTTELSSKTAAVLESQHKRRTSSQHQKDLPSLPRKDKDASQESLATTPSSDSNANTSDSSNDHHNASTSNIPPDPDLSPTEQRLQARLNKVIASKDALQRKIYDLEAEVADWRRLAEVTRVEEIDELRLECEHMQERVKMFEDINKELRKAAAAAGSSRGGRSRSRSARTSPELPNSDTEDIDRSARRGEHSKGMATVLEARVKDMLERLQDVEKEKLRVENELLEERFEKKKAVEAAERLGRRATELEETLGIMRDVEDEREAKIHANIIPGLSVTLGQLRASTSRLLAKKSHDELVAIIDHLARLTEKLKSDNDTFKKNGGLSNAKYMEMVKEIKLLRKSKMDAAELLKSNAITDSQLAKVEQENAKLRKQLRKEAERFAESRKKIQDLDVKNERLSAELAKARSPHGGNVQTSGSLQSHTDLDLHGSIRPGSPADRSRINFAEEIARLKGQIAERDAIIENMVQSDNTSHEHSDPRKLKREMEMWRARANQLTEELAQHLASRSRKSPPRSPEERDEADRGELRGGIGEVVAERNSLRDAVESLQLENAKLRVELSQFDQAFFDELDELKNNYRDSVKLNLQYEEHIQRLCHAAVPAQAITLGTILEEDQVIAEIKEFEY
ncbi:hypothetical protein HDU76_005628 [Blyttiomyces sp. JEL0837]|nr:hypothetical protein HDU76_005628 [Blyttiomyces sp. JEL0837]